MIEELLKNYESLVYPCTYFGTLAIVGFWEVFCPRRSLSASLFVRWTSAFCLMVINTVIFRFATPILVIPFAVFLAENQIGFFNNVATPFWASFLISFWLIDLSRWTQHWLLHRVPVLWLLHRAHHTDHDYDFTTGLRFHPGDALFTTASHFLMIGLLGAPVESVILYEVLFVIFALFAHGNLKIPLGIERVLRIFIVTPDLHRVHHSAASDETDSNFGGIVPWWDRLLGTYRDQPEAGHEGMIIGLDQFRDPRHLKVYWILINPFLSAAEHSDPGLRMVAEQPAVPRVDTP